MSLPNHCVAMLEMRYREQKPGGVWLTQYDKAGLRGWLTRDAQLMQLPEPSE
jgi:hypothetical protein